MRLNGAQYHLEASLAVQLPFLKLYRHCMFFVMKIVSTELRQRIQAKWLLKKGTCDLTPKLNLTYVMTATVMPNNITPCFDILCVSVIRMLHCIPHNLPDKDFIYAKALMNAEYKLHL